MDETDNVIKQLRKSIIEMAVESWRFRSVFEKAISKLDAGESSRYVSQLNWFIKKTAAALENVGLRLVNVEGKEYDIGMAVTPLNMDDFDEHDCLFVDRMIEPIIMDAESVFKMGTVILGRTNK